MDSTPSKPPYAYYPRREINKVSSPELPRRRRRDHGARVPWQMHCGLTSLCLFNVACVLDSGIVSSNNSHFRGSIVSAYWTSTSILLASAASQPYWARFLSPGRELSLNVPLGLALLGKSLTFQADGFPLLLAGRTVQGLGAGGLLCFTPTLVDRLLEADEERPWRMAFLLIWVVASAFGPVLEGLCLEALHLKWVRYLSMPLYAAGIMLRPDDNCCAMKYNGLHVSAVRSRGPASVGLLATTCLVAFATMTLVSITNAGTNFNWVSVPAIVLTVLSLCGLIGSLLFAVKRPWRKWLRWPLLSSRAWQYVGFGLHGLLTFAVVQSLPLYFQFDRERRPILAAVASIPFAVGVLLSSAYVARRCADRSTSWHRWNDGGWLVTMFGLAILPTAETSVSTAGWAMISTVGGIGLGTTWSATHVMVAQQKHRSPRVMTNMIFAHSVGQALGVCLAGVVFQNVFQARIAQDPLLRSDARWWTLHALTYLVNPVDQSGQAVSEESQRTLLAGHLDGFRALWISLACIAWVTARTGVAYNVNQDDSISNKEERDREAQVRKAKRYGRIWE